MSTSGAPGAGLRFATVTTRAYVELPAGWGRDAARGFGPFVTGEELRRADGSRTTWDSRWHRKHHNTLTRRGGSTWWAPGAIGWWIGCLFMIGSACFAIGSTPGYVDAVGAAAADATFFVGSIFFTLAALAQYLEVVNAAPRADGAGAPHVRWWRWAPRRIDWWATLVQLVGTVYFNLSTFHALQSGLDAQAANRLVWRPDVLGSVCFLVASALAWFEVCHTWAAWRVGDVSWWIGLLNLLGSVAFGVSAFAAKVVSSSGELRNVELVNLGTFVGAVAFFAGALLLLPERTRAADSPARPTTVSSRST
jgi:hypothetical protein